jgi:tetratricopeptide (TPR) repeat protein
MDNDLISREILERFANRTATSQERRSVVRHLLERCPACKSYLIPLLPAQASMRRTAEMSADLKDDQYDEPVDRAVRRFISSLAPEGVNPAKKLLTELGEHPPQRQETLVRNQRRYWTIDLCNLLIDQSHEARFRDLTAMRHRSRLALLIAEQLDPAAQGTVVHDCRARAWMAFGNALRVSGELQSAGAALAEAESQLASGTADQALAARLLSHWASLHFDQRRFEESLSLLARAAEIWRRLHNPREVALALIKQAMATGEGGRPKGAIHLLLEAGRLVDSAADPKLALIILHNIIRFHVYGGRSDLAQRLFVEARPLYRQERDPLIHAKELWVEGQIMSAQGQLELAVRLLSRAREGFLAQGNRYEAGIVSLDLAAVFAKLGKLAEVRVLARETVREMKSQGVRREGIAALILLMQAETTEAALILIRQIASAVRAPR